MSTSWWEMHTPDNAREVQVPPCACGHTHTRTQTVHPARFGEQRESPEEKKKTGRLRSAVFTFSVPQPNKCLLQHVSTSLSKTTKFMEIKKKQKQKMFHSIALQQQRAVGQ